MMRVREQNQYQLCETDVIVPVMGLTGVGKSAFIEKLTGEDAGVGHTLVSATSGVGMYCFESAGRRVYLVDTPGFNDTNKSDSLVFKEIAFFLGQAYKSGAKIGGILYLHRITDNRVSGSAARGFGVMEKLCGADAARFTILVTSMWDAIHSDELHEAYRRDEELTDTDTFWGSMHRKGSRNLRWLGTTASAHTILSTLLYLSDNQGPVVLKIQRELIEENLDLDDTSAGLELAKHHGAAWQQLRRELSTIKTAYEQAVLSRDNGAAETLANQQREIQNRLDAAETAERDLRVDLESLFSTKMEEYTEMFNAVELEATEIQRHVQTLETNYVELDAQQNVEMEVYQRETRRYREHRAVMRSDLERQALDEKQMERQRRHEEARARAEAKRRAMEKELERARKKKLMKRNALAILGMLGGLATIAAGGATMQIPVVAAGIALFGTAGMKLDFSRKKKLQPKDKEWEVQEYDAS